jgi:SAM-dependent methyltransferase
VIEEPLNPEPSSPDPEPACRICGHAGGNRRIRAREMMYGTRKPFDYFECAQCGTVQIQAIPEDLSPYYTRDYYSFDPPRLKQGRLRTFLRRHRARHYLGFPTLVGRLAAHRPERRPPVFRFLKAAGASQDTPILDVGCGGGTMLAQLWKYGFRDLTGIDPFLDQDRQFTPSFRIFKKSIAEEARRYPLVMMHHSFEHMAEPLAVLRQARERLTDGGILLVRIPLAGTYAWRHYGRDWAQLDAPRHLHLLTERSLRALAESAGLRVREVIYDSESFQFWASEQIRRDIPILDPRSYCKDPRGSMFSREQIRAFQAEAERLNAARDGDMAGFLLGRAAD